MLQNHFSKPPPFPEMARYLFNILAIGFVRNNITQIKHHDCSGAEAG
ncbi:MAG: hypothetical protein ACI854_002168, partial [Arenicella sp.]